MWSLKVVRGAELIEKLAPEMKLPQPLRSFTIGREPASEWVMTDRARAISARHCEIVGTSRGPVLRDLSTNGTFVNGATSRLVGDHLLCDGDRIEVGQVVIQVSGPQQQPQVAAAPPPPPAAAVAPRASGGTANAARGGDPAAMLAQGVGADGGGLTEILRAAPVASDSGLELTKIRPASPPPAGVPAAPGTAAPPPRRPQGALAAAATQQTPEPLLPPVTVAAASVSTRALTEALARGLGVPATALADQDPLLMAQRLASCALAGAAALRQLMDHQAQARRSIGSRRSALAPLRDANPLRLAASTPAAALALASQPQADTAILWQRSADELCAHQDHLLQAFRSAVQRLGAQIEPEALQQAAAPGGEAAVRHAEPAHLWELYLALWSGMGLGPGQSWPAGFEEAALQHLAAAYDEAPC